MLVFGDSNAYRPANGRHCWPAMLQRISGGRLRVFNESQDGRTTRYDAGERNGLSVIASTLRRHGPLDWVFLALGTNDMKSQYGPPDAADVVDGIGSLIDVIMTRGDGAEPVVVLPPPVGEQVDGDLGGASHRLPAVVRGYRQLAATRKIAVIDLLPVVNAADDLCEDGVHLNARGRRHVADAVWRYLARKLQPVAISDMTIPPAGPCGPSNR